MSPYRPAEFGDEGLRHEVNVFVYRYGTDGPEYLLLHPQPHQDGFWRPVIGAVDLDEDLRHAALRRVRLETGLEQAWDLVIPAAGLVEDLGDLRLVEWPFGCEARPGWPGPRLRDPRTAWNWASFERALDILSRSLHRQNLLQLHLRLAA